MSICLSAALLYAFITPKNVHCIQLQNRGIRFFLPNPICLEERRRAFKTRKEALGEVVVDSGREIDGNKFHSDDGWDQNHGAGGDLSTCVVCERV